MTLASRATQYFFANPKIKLERAVPARAMRMIGFLPYRSEILPQIMAVDASAMANAEIRRPA